MAMPAPTARWTIEMVRAMPNDGNRYEVIDGVLWVTPAPSFTHQRAVLGLAVRLHAYLREHPIAAPIIAPADVEFQEPHTMVEPDVFAVPLIEGRLPRNFLEAGRLLLAVEVLSPSSARADRDVKRRLYQRQGVPEYWIVDLDARLIERWRPADERPEILTDQIEWQPDPTHPPLAMELPAFFAEVWGE
jgi:Uma2 family endonuclease